MKVTATELRTVMVIEPQVFADAQSGKLPFTSELDNGLRMNSQEPTGLRRGSQCLQNVEFGA